MYDTSLQEHELRRHIPHFGVSARQPRFESKEDALRHFHTRRLMRIAFYRDLGRKPPTSPAHLPSYVRAVKKHWGLQFNNSARRLIAYVEGFDSWEEALHTE